MAVTPVEVQHGLFSGPMLSRCPECRSDRLRPVVDVDEPNFLCRACGRCWHVEFGRVSRVHPSTCMGCMWRDECRAGTFST